MTKQEILNKIKTAKPAAKQETGIHFVKCGSKMIRTADNRLNTWVRSLDDGQMYRTNK